MAPHYDLEHLILSVVGAVGWSRHIGWSWNAPFWSVSVEVVAYAVFYVVVRLAGAGTLVAIGVAAAMAGARGVIDGRLITGIGLFFLGGVVCHVARGIAAWAQMRRIETRWVLGGIAVVGAAGAGGVALTDGRLQIGDGGVRVLLDYVLFPYIVGALAVLGMLRPGTGRSLAWFGDLTYAIYLLHFPLQVAVMSGLVALGLDRTVLFTLPGMLGFLAVLLLLAHLTYVHFECPARTWVLERLGGGRGVAARS